MEKQFDNEWKYYERDMEELAELKHMKELDRAQKESYQEGYNDAMDDVVRLIDYKVRQMKDGKCKFQLQDKMSNVWSNEV